MINLQQWKQFNWLEKPEVLIKDCIMTADTARHLWSSFNQPVKAAAASLDPCEKVTEQQCLQIWKHTEQMLH